MNLATVNIGPLVAFKENGSGLWIVRVRATREELGAFDSKAAAVAFATGEAPRVARIARHNAMRVRKVATSKNPDGRGWRVRVLERDNSATVFDEEGIPVQTLWIPLHTVTRGTAKGRDRAYSLVRAAHIYGPNLPA